MQGLIMDFELTIPVMLRRAEQLFGSQEIVTRLPDRSLHRYTYADFIPRARRLGAALTELGMGRGDRVATLAWNHYQHLEAYLGIPAFGGVTHTLNLRLHPNDVGYIAKHGGDKLLIVDESLLPLAQKFLGETDIEQVIVIGEAPEGTISYEELIAGTEDPGEYPEIEEREAAAMCYTSGTTGHPKGALYSHRAIFLHTLVATMSGVLSISEADTVLPVVPMFHANAWGFPFSCTMVGAKQVFPGPHLDPPSLLELFQDERVTITGGVPTIWLGILQVLDQQPDAYDLSSLRAMIVGGAAAPRSLIEGLQERHGLYVLHAWGMTEMAPLGTTAQLPPDLEDASDDEQYAFRAKQGRPAPLVEIRARGEDGVVPWDGKTMGELEVRGPWISSSYYDAPEGADRWTDDGWFKTGDVVTIDARGCIEIQDRSKDLVKSGGEWISSVALENALMGHPAVAEAAVIAVPDEQWSERPLAVCVFKEGESATDEELREHLASSFAKFQLPERFEFVDEIPKTAVGKFKKTALREQFAQEQTPAPGR
jgi:fatty-acyl-CoA synthase